MLFILTHRYKDLNNLNIHEILIIFYFFLYFSYDNQI